MNTDDKEPGPTDPIIQIAIQEVGAQTRLWALTKSGNLYYRHAGPENAIQLDAWHQIDSDVSHLAKKK